MKLGISTACYYPMTTEASLKSVVKGGAPCTEIFFNSFSELSAEYIRELKEILRGGQTTVTSVHPFTSALEPMLFFGDYPRRFDDGIEMYKQYFEAAAQLGGAYCVLHGAFSRHMVSMEQYLDAYGKLHTEAKRFGIRIAQENVGRCMSRDPKLFECLRTAIPDVAFVLDIKQTFRSECSVEATMDAMGSNIVHLHFSDANEKNDCLPVGYGNFDFAELFARLQAIDYGGDAVLELYRHSYTDEKQLWTSLIRMQNMIKT